MKKHILIIAACILLLAGGILFSITQLNILSVFASFSHYKDSEAKDEGKDFTMLALGDSLSYGVGNSGNSGYVGNVEKRLEGQLNKEITVEDYGVPDDTSAQLLKRLQSEQLKSSVSGAEMIFLNIGMNDYLNSLLTSKSRPKEGNQIIRKALLTYQHNLKAAFQKIRRENPKARIYMVGIYNPFPNRTDKLQESKLIHQWNRTAVEVASHQKNTTFVSVEDVFIGKNKKDYFSDELHPNKKGYTLIGSEVYKHLNLN
ncbi:GDSL-type esterase/lipase family protein [Fictibacillus fluitans]|uniref:GDSL-type esterase/lipase family protein n=1 Tax=Fictibacillus fluitans TaxID=3058422 RepID=A0ABT8HY09_9BACL|nr:GDSL-type esterase/lipase family protein [Fictibacillus sp. NE201]MDN4525657.1 GDSL-type esterase/lipase family protein [Fictibacillus sp. NE201]